MPTVKERAEAVVSWPISLSVERAIEQAMADAWDEGAEAAFDGMPESGSDGAVFAHERKTYASNPYRSKP
jgi:hypothetical protein